MSIIDLSSHRLAPEIWTCHCGTVSFNLYRDGRIECCGCNAMQDTMRGTWIVPEYRSAEVKEFPAATVCSVCGSQSHRAASCPKRPGQ